MAAAVMTVSTINVHPTVDGRLVEAIISYDTGDYATGGVAIAASDFGLSTLSGITVIGSSVHLGEYDHVAGKMLLRVKATGAQVANAAALTTASSIKVRAFGT